MSLLCHHPDFPTSTAAAILASSRDGSLPGFKAAYGTGAQAEPPSGSHVSLLVIRVYQMEDIKLFSCLFSFEC